MIEGATWGSSRGSASWMLVGEVGIAGRLSSIGAVVCGAGVADVVLEAIVVGLAEEDRPEPVPGSPLRSSSSGSGSFSSPSPRSESIGSVGS